MKRALILLFSLLPASLMWLSCGYKAPSSGGGGGSGLKTRAFVTNSVTSGSGPAGVYMVNAQTDVRVFVSPISAGNTPGMMVVTPNRTQTLVFSGDGTQFSLNQLTIINNANEAAAAQVTLPGVTESIVVSPDGSAAYAAVPTASVIGQSPGVVKAISLSSGTFTGEVDIPSVHYLSIDNSGNRILGFSDNSDAVAVITPSNIGIGNAVSYIGGPGVFDRPVAAFFSSDDSTAYVLSCGAECGGTQASVQQLNLVTNELVASVPACVPSGNPQQPCASPAAGSVALVNGSTMYVAGTPPLVGGVPQQPCTGENTAAQSCGLLTVLNLSTPMSVTNAAPIVITDGYHDRIALGANGQLLIGARTCTEIATTAETRGCLSIYNTQSVAVGSIQPGAVTIPPANGDVTGIQPIATRNVVYVIQGIQGGSLGIYDTTTDALDAVEMKKITNLIGSFVDVKTIDF